MTDNEFINAWDILCKFDFFGGQRAGRELWNEKPTDIQDKDVEAFANDVAYLKDFINRQKAEIAEQQSEIEILKDSNINLQELYQTEREKVKTAKQKCIDIVKALKTAKTDTIKEFASELIAKLSIIPQHHFTFLQVAYDVDNLVNKKVGED